MLTSSDGVLYGVAPDLEYDLDIYLSKTDVEYCGTRKIVQGSRTNFPSLEVWLYEDGKRPLLLYFFSAANRGLTDIMFKTEF